MTYILAKLLHKLNAPGLVRPMRDHYNGVTIEVSVSQVYTKIDVNGRTYFFNRESGKYDGWGMTQQCDVSEGNTP